MPSVYDIARTVKLPGVTTTVTLNPAHLSVRISNAVRKAMQTGIVKGRGQSAQLVRKLFDMHGISFVGVTSYGVGRFGRFDMSGDKLQAMSDLHEAYLVSEMTTTTNEYSQRFLKDHRHYFNAFTTTARDFLPLYSTVLAAQMAELVAQCRYDVDVQKSADLLARFDQNETFVFNFDSF